MNKDENGKKMFGKLDSSFGSRLEVGFRERKKENLRFVIRSDYERPKNCMEKRQWCRGELSQRVVESVCVVTLIVDKGTVGRTGVISLKIL